jgi:heme/copper-type cytochrome/quinol oxidase subunit 2
VTDRLPRPKSSHVVFAVIATALCAAVTLGAFAVDQARREFDVVSRRYDFRVTGADRPEIRVQQDDLVHITFSTEDIPHSFTIEEAPYRIMRRAEPGKPVSFNFRADEPGRFRFFCNLTADEKCRGMEGFLIVERRR